jgi:hypothetical protein
MRRIVRGRRIDRQEKGMKRETKREREGRR